MQKTEAIPLSLTELYRTVASVTLERKTRLKLATLSLEG